MLVHIYSKGRWCHTILHTECAKHKARILPSSRKRRSHKLLSKGKMFGARGTLKSCGAARRHFYGRRKRLHHTQVRFLIIDGPHEKERSSPGSRPVWCPLAAVLPLLHSEADIFHIRQGCWLAYVRIINLSLGVCGELLKDSD